MSRFLRTVCELKLIAIPCQDLLTDLSSRCLLQRLTPTRCTVVTKVMQRRSFSIGIWSTNPTAKLHLETFGNEPSLGPTMIPKIESKVTGELPEAKGVPTHVPASSTWPRAFFKKKIRSQSRKRPAYWRSQQHEPQSYEAINNCMIISFALYEILRAIVFHAPNPHTRAASPTGKLRAMRITRNFFGRRCSPCMGVRRT